MVNPGAVGAVVKNGSNKGIEYHGSGVGGVQSSTEAVKIAEVKIGRLEDDYYRC